MSEDKKMRYFPIYSSGVLGKNRALLKTKDAIFDTLEEAKEEAEELLIYRGVRLPIFFTGDILEKEEGEGIEGVESESLGMLIISGPDFDEVD